MHDIAVDIEYERHEGIWISPKHLSNNPLRKSNHLIRWTPDTRALAIVFHQGRNRLYIVPTFIIKLTPNFIHTVVTKSWKYKNKKRPWRSSSRISFSRRSSRMMLISGMTIQDCKEICWSWMSPIYRRTMCFRFPRSIIWRP
jgi:hypothetical protein